MSRSIVAAIVLAAAAGLAGLAFYLLRPGPSSTRGETAGALAPVTTLEPLFVDGRRLAALLRDYQLSLLAM